MTFSEQIVYAMFKPGKLKEIMELEKKRHVWFVIVMMLVLGIVTFVVPAGAIVKSFGGFENLFRTKLSSIQYDTKTGLSLDKKFQFKIDGYAVLIDTEDETMPDEKIKAEGIVFAVGSKNIRLVVATQGQFLDYQTVPLSNLFINDFDCEYLVRMIPGIYGYMFMIFLGNCVYYFLKYALFALVLSIFAGSVNRVNELGLKKGQVFMICFYSLTFAYVLYNFNFALGLIPAFLVLFVCIFSTIRYLGKGMSTFDKSKQI